MPKAPKLTASLRRRLEAAGYVWDDERADWSHPKSGRRLDTIVACAMTPEQLAEWIRAGAGQERKR